jgi:hypothetical protein
MLGEESRRSRARRRGISKLKPRCRQQPKPDRLHTANLNLAAPEAGESFFGQILKIRASVSDRKGGHVVDYRHA